MSNDSAHIKEIIETASPGFAVLSVAFEGEGDFCRAYTVNDTWLFRFAYNSEGSVSVEREARLLPILAPTLTVNIPNPSHLGHDPSTGFAFMGYPKIEGVQLTGALLKTVSRPEQDSITATIALFLRDLHGFDTERARHLGVPETDYPLARTEDGIMPGHAVDIYREQSAKLLSYRTLDKKTRAYCTRLADQLIESAQHPILPAVLTHGDLSQDHVLLDPSTNGITGIIDFSDAILTTPLLDYMYLYHAYGSDFLATLLALLHPNDMQSIASQVQLLHAWYLAIRLLWALEHNYSPGIEPNLKMLSAAMNASSQTT